MQQIHPHPQTVIKWCLVLLLGLGAANVAGAVEDAPIEDAPAAESLEAANTAQAQATDVEQPVIESAVENTQNMPQSAHSRSGVLQLDQTVISGNQELPKVLYILPWREPEGLPDIEIQAEFTEEEVFRRLYPPAYRRELGYFETLSGLKEDPAQEK